MFPGIDGFHWTAQHVIFLGLFFSVLVVVATTFSAALVRSYAAADDRQVDRIRWLTDFEDLPARDRRCRRQLTGELIHRTCPNAFRCAECDAFQASRRTTSSSDIGDTFGLDYRANRLYHRGHTWVESRPDGTVVIGLDDLARRVIGVAEVRETPPVGAHVHEDGIGWNIHQSGSIIRVLAPVAGEVLEIGQSQDDWVLRLRPDTPDVPQLLRGSEVSAWVRDELDRLQVLLTPAGSIPALADGGVVVDDLQQAIPEKIWDHVAGSLMLQP